MQAEFMDQMKDFAKPANEFNKLATSMIKRVTEQNMAMMDDFLNSSIKQMKDLGSIKKPEDFIAIQSALANEASTKMMNNSQKMMNMAMENFSEFSKWLEESTSHASKAASHAVNTATGKASSSSK